MARPAQLRDVAALALAHREAPAHFEVAGTAASCGSGLGRHARARRSRKRRDAGRGVALNTGKGAAPPGQGWCFCITASSVSWLGFSVSAARQIFCASSRWPLLHRTSPRWAAISGSGRAL